MDKRKLSTGCFKKTHLKKMADIFNPKNVTSGSCVYENLKIASFCPIGQISPVLNENLEFE